MNFAVFLQKKMNINWSSKRVRYFIIFLLLSVVFVLVYLIFLRNIFSTENIALQILSPKQAANGEEITWLVNIKNNSNVRIENIKLVFEYPSGTFDKEGKVKKREEVRIDKIISGGEEDKSFSGIIFGRKNDQKKAKARITYNPQGLSTEFENKTSSSTLLINSFIIFEMKIPERVQPEEEFTISLSWQSVLSFPLTNMQLRLTLPKGFERTSEKLGEERQDLENLSEQERTGQSKIIFDLGALNEGEGNTIEIKGRILGETGKDKLFKAEFGKFDEILYEFIPLASVERAVKIIFSTINIFRKVNGESEYVARPDEKLSYIVNFKNAGGNVYQNLTLTIELESNFLDFTTLKAQGGKIEGISANSKRIIFLPTDIPELLFLGSYDEGNVGFSVNVKSDIPSQNAFIKEKITIGGITKSFQTKIGSKTHFYQYSYYTLPIELKDKISTGGTFPIAKDQETTLVIHWRVTNKGNNLQDVKIRGILADNVNWTGVIFPANVGFSFDNNTRILTLNIGNVSYNFAQNYAFQIKIKPKEIPQDLISGSKFYGKDTWTGQVFEVLAPNLDTSSVQ